MRKVVASVIATSALAGLFGLIAWAAPDLSLSYQDNPDPAAVGLPITYTLVIENDGPDPATGVLVTNTLPGGVTFGSVTPGSPTCAETGGTITCALGSLGAGGVVTVTTVVTPNAVGTLTSTVDVGASELSAALNITQTTAVVDHADLSVSKAAGPIPAFVGAALNYTVTISNAGPSAAAGLVLTDTLPGNILLRATSLAFGDDSGPDFNGGTHADTVWDSANSWLELASGSPDQAGEFTSRVFDGQSARSWTTLSWLPQRPIQKELPSNGAVESGYPAGAADMTGNVLLMHLNEPAGATTFSDSSGYGHVGTCAGLTCPAGGVPGKFTTAFDFDGDTVGYGDYVSIPDSPSLDLTQNFSLEAWVRWDGVGGYRAIVSKPRKDINTYQGAATGYALVVSDGMPGLALAVGSGNRVALDPVSLPAQVWTHVAAVYTGQHTHVYVNGSERVVQDWGSPEDVLVGTTALLIGREFNFELVERAFDGDIDEVAVFARSLSAEEVKDHYLRGALRLKLQARSCDDPACSGEPLVGPDGTAGSYYSELGSTAGTPPVLNLTNLASNRYFQYQADLESDNSSYSPELREVDVSASAGCTGTAVLACSLGTLGAGGVLSVRIGVTPTAVGQITNTVIAASALLDPFPANNTASISTTVTALPTISAIADHTTYKNTTTKPIPFTLGDVDTPLSSLTVSGTSSNQALVPNANILFGGSGAARTVTITPAANQVGTSLITISVSDGASQVAESFNLTVSPINVYLPAVQTPRPSRGIYGTVTDYGGAAAGVYLELRYYNGSSWSTRASQYTAFDGTYSFLGLPALLPGEQYYVRYSNNEDATSRLAAWFTRVLDAYSAGAEVNIGNFDVSNVNLASPGPGTLVPLPAAFSWGTRAATPSDSYVYNLFDFYSDAYFFTAPLGYTPNYVLSSLPAGFATYVEYYWYVAVVSPDGGAGLSYWAYGVSFSNTGQAVAGPQLPARPLWADDPPQPRPHPKRAASAPTPEVPR